MLMLKVVCYAKRWRLTVLEPCVWIWLIMLHSEEGWTSIHSQMTVQMGGSWIRRPCRFAMIAHYTR